jgi:sigma-B regulation protein RsbU (phosphoserine phosphatase)
MRNRQSEIQDEILIVDDTPANLRLLAQMLSERGYIVRAVTSGARALESLQVTPPNLILLDIRMPEMDGYEVCERIKEDPQTSDIPIIFISALNEIGDKVRGFNVGGVDYITKPFQFEEVLARVETHLSLRRLQKQLQEANKKFELELALAGSLQSSFFPEEPPEVPGWELSVVLKPARETSGDFYDVYTLPNGMLGFLVADVVDKGAAAALYMALSWTLIRTYAAEYPEEPDRVLSEVNQRIIFDTDSSRFVTVFYGVLDPSSGKLKYCNAGHNPPYLIRAQDGKKVERLTKTGVLLGMFEDESWEKDVVQFDHGDVLVLYTDGVTEAQNAEGDFFGRERLVKVAKKNSGGTAKVVRESLLGKISQFVGDAPQMDDMALVVIARKKM